MTEKFETDWEAVIMDEIANPVITRADVAQTYAYVCNSRGTKADYAKINQAIMNRWSKSGLVWIKAHAQKHWGALG